MKVGLIGAGRIGAFHARTLASNREVTSLRIVDANLARAKSVAHEVGAETALDAEDLIRRSDALVIATATDTHADLIRLGADAKLPVFCEKPISLKLETTDRVLEHVDKAGIPLQIGFQRRFDRGYAEARHLVASGELGRLYAARLATHDPEPPPEQILKASGGLFRDLMIHDFDIVRWTTGQEVEEVQVAAGVLTGDSAFVRLDDVDTAVAILRLQNGALAVLSGLRHDPRGYDVRLELFGSKDSVVVGMDSRTPLRPLDDDREWTEQPAYRDFLERFAPAYREELHAFLLMAQGKADNRCSGADARESLRVSLAAMASLREKRPVAVEEIR